MTIFTRGKKAKKIKPDVALKMIEQKGNTIILDVRTEAEFAMGRLKDSILIPIDDVEYRIKTEVPDKATQIIIYCRSGVKSGIAARKLLEMGYTSIYNLGGIIDWPYEVVN